MRIFVHTGGELENQNLPELHVQLDVMFPGSLGAPLDPAASSEPITAQMPLGKKSWPVLNILALMSSKLNAYAARSEPKDYHDILFLLSAYWEEIHNVRGQLDSELKQRFVNGFVGQNAGPGKLNQVRRVKHIMGVP